MVIANNYPLFVAIPQVHKGHIELRSIQTNNLDRLVQPKMLSSTRELPMPNVSKLSSLSQAHATLLHCWTKLSRFTRDYPSPSPSPVSSTSPQQTSPIVEERQNFQRWLEQWEVAFTAFLTNAMASMTNEDVTQSRILKTNHLACTILASDADPPAFDAFEAEFRAIIELAGAVLRSRYLADSPQDTKANESPTIPAGLDVKDPLHVVRSRCNEATIRRRAIELLSRFYSHEAS